MGSKFQSRNCKREFAVKRGERRLLPYRGKKNMCSCPSSLLGPCHYPDATCHARTAYRRAGGPPPRPSSLITPPFPSVARQACTRLLAAAITCNTVGSFTRASRACFRGKHGCSIYQAPATLPSGLPDLANVILLTAVTLDGAVA